jgi:hypothetical protein
MLIVLDLLSCVRHIITQLELECRRESDDHGPASTHSSPRGMLQELEKRFIRTYGRNDELWVPANGRG